MEKEIKIVSTFSLLQDDHDVTIYPAINEHVQNFAYIAVEPYKRQLTLLYHSWGKGFW